MHIFNALSANGLGSRGSCPCGGKGVCTCKLTRNQLSNITINFNGRLRRETLNGRSYMVAPLTLIVPGVLNGSKGPLYYPPSEISKDPMAWNNVPITLDHPKNQVGEPVSGRDPHIIRNFGMGYVFNAHIRNGKLVAEGWFDVDKTARVSPEIFTRLKAGRPIELSTGLFTDNEPKRGVYNGRDFHFIARNYRPDHLAVFSDKVGACSLEDGCGVLVNYNKNHDEQGRFSSGTGGGGANGQVSLAKATPSRSPENVHGATFTNKTRSIKSRVAGGIAGTAVGTAAGYGLAKAGTKLGAKFIEKKLGVPASMLEEIAMPLAKTRGAFLGGAIGAGAGSVSDLRPTHRDKRNFLTRAAHAGISGAAGMGAGTIIGAGVGYISAMAQGPKRVTKELVKEGIRTGARLGGTIGGTVGAFDGFRGDKSTKEKIDYSQPKEPTKLSKVAGAALSSGAQGAVIGGAGTVGFQVGRATKQAWHVLGDPGFGDGGMKGLERIKGTASAVGQVLKMPLVRKSLKYLGGTGAVVGGTLGAAAGAHSVFSRRKPTGNAVFDESKHPRAADGKFGSGGGSSAARKPKKERPLGKSGRRMRTERLLRTSTPKNLIGGAAVGYGATTAGMAAGGAIARKYVGPFGSEATKLAGKVVGGVVGSMIGGEVSRRKFDVAGEQTAGGGSLFAMLTGPKAAGRAIAGAGRLAVKGLRAPGRVITKLKAARRAGQVDKIMKAGLEAQRAGDKAGTARAAAAYDALKTSKKPRFSFPKRGDEYKLNELASNAIGPRVPRMQARARNGQFGSGGGAAGRAARRTKHLEFKARKQALHGTTPRLPKKLRAFTPAHAGSKPAKPPGAPPAQGAVKRPPIAETAAKVRAQYAERSQGMKTPAQKRTEIHAKFQEAQGRAVKEHSFKASVTKSPTMKAYHERKVAEAEDQVAANEDGRWITTKGGKHIFIDGDGNITKGNIGQKKESTASKIGKGAAGVAAGVGGSLVGEALGASIGTAAGAGLGALVGGAGAVPGAAIGHFVGGTLGAIGGGMAASHVARKVGGESAGKGADIGGIAGTLGGTLLAKAGSKVGIKAGAKLIAKKPLIPSGRSAYVKGIRAAKASQIRATRSKFGYADKLSVGMAGLGAAGELSGQ